MRSARTALNFISQQEHDRLIPFMHIMKDPSDLDPPPSTCDTQVIVTLWHWSHRPPSMCIVFRSHFTSSNKHLQFLNFNALITLALFFFGVRNRKKIRPNTTLSDVLCIIVLVWPFFPWISLFFLLYCNEITQHNQRCRLVHLETGCVGWCH
jgi:hypothetical protein